METILIAIRDCGDGSQSLDWFYNVDKNTLREHLKNNERYQLSDGVQVTGIKVNSVKEFIANNPYLFAEDFNKVVKNYEDLMGDPDEYDYD